MIDGFILWLDHFIDSFSIAWSLLEVLMEMHWLVIGFFVTALLW